MSRRLLWIVPFLAFGCATTSPRLSERREADYAMLTTAAQASLTMKWLQLLERGETNTVAMGMRSHLIFQEMILRGFLREYPDVPNAETASLIHERLQTFLKIEQQNPAEEIKGLLEQLERPSD